MLLDLFSLLFTPGPPAPNPPASPVNVKVFPRQNYNVLKWDKVTTDTVGSPVTVEKYLVYSSPFINEANLQLRATIDALDINGDVDTAFVDPDPQEVLAYRVSAVATISLIVLESDRSSKVISVRSPSQIDSKTELIDRLIFKLDGSSLDEGILA